jgi:hypothetical protein
MTPRKTVTTWNAFMNASDYIRSNFEPNDRLAVVLINKRADAVIQRLSTAAIIAGPDFQAWLKIKNAQAFEVYISMNGLKPDARGRTKADVAEVRHLYLDFDENGTAATRAVLKQPDLPPPNYLVNTSKDKWQVIWRVEGFGREEAETLQKGLARRFGADPAATDCARVLRLPDFYNHKYAEPYLVRVDVPDSGLGRIHRRAQFPAIAALEPHLGMQGAGVQSGSRKRAQPGELSQSERDWAYAKRALARGESPAIVAAAIASYRRFDKHNPKYYAELTVQKAALALKAGQTIVDDTPERT